MLWADKHFEIVDFTKNKLVLVSSKLWDSIFNYILWSHFHIHQYSHRRDNLGLPKLINKHTSLAWFVSSTWFCPLFILVLLVQFYIWVRIYAILVHFGDKFWLYIRSLYKDCTFRPYIQTAHSDRTHSYHTDSYKFITQALWLIPVLQLHGTTNFSLSVKKITF